MEIRLAQPGDAEAIRQIYNTEVTGSSVTLDLVPRSPEAQREWMDARSGAHAVVVAVEHGDVLGFASLSPYRDRAAYATTVEQSVYVHRDHRRRGVASALIAQLMDVATSHGFHTVIARVVGDHEASISLHESCGFDRIGREREVGRKFNRWLDIVVMQRML